VALKGALQDFAKVSAFELTNQNHVVIQVGRKDTDTGHVEVHLFDFVLVVLEVADEAPMAIVEEWQRTGQPVTHRVVEEVPLQKTN